MHGYPKERRVSTQTKKSESAAVSSVAAIEKDLDDESRNITGQSREIQPWSPRLHILTVYQHNDCHSH